MSQLTAILWKLAQAYIKRIGKDRVKAVFQTILDEL